MKHLRLAVPVCALVFAMFSTWLPAQERKPPKRPAEPFTVFVFTDGLVNEDVDMPKVADEVRKRIKKKKRWLRVVDTREGADFVVEVMTHVVSEQHRTKLDQRVNANGIGKSWMDQNYVTERHRIETRVELPSGAQILMTGADERDRGGSMKGAASNVADRLENHCKENYWKFVES